MKAMVSKLWSLFFSMVLAAELAFVLDIGIVYTGTKLRLAVFLGLWAGLVLILSCCKFLNAKRKAVSAAVVALSLLVIGLAAYGVWAGFAKSADYTVTDDGKEALYGGKNVLAIVPHQDDEVNILGGVLEEYVHYGSTVRVVYVTNGDFYGIPETRLREAIAYCAFVGIPEENVIFLGYGDGWNQGKEIHLYNAEPDTVMTSHYGRTATYGLDTHPAYHDGNAYTVDNFISDLESVILEYRPDVIFCSDYDSHMDHKSTTLGFEKAMGNILRHDSGYQPLVFKGYAYKAAWYAEADFYEVNILSTQNIFAEPYLQEPEVYRWEDRVRFPVAASTLSRSLVQSDGYRSLAVHTSQEAQKHAISVVNGDKVFWQRRTDGICYQAEVSASSGDAMRLNDFMLIDNHDLWMKEEPFDGVWIPEGADRTATISFPEETDLFSIVLYDHPSKTDNVLNAVIRFHDGTQLETGPLCQTGAATEVLVNKTGITGFSVTLTETEGSSAGLTEIEAYTQPFFTDGGFIKLMDDGGNFVYDYFADKDVTELSLYRYGALPEAGGEHYTVGCDNDACSAVWNGQRLVVTCPSGEACAVTVTLADGTVSDSVWIQNPGAFRYWYVQAGQFVEKCWETCVKETAVFRTLSRFLG